MKRRINRASYTVEAAIWIPVYLFLIAGAIGCGVDLYREIADQENAAKAVWAVSEFYQKQIFGEVLDD